MSNKVKCMDVSKNMIKDTGWDRKYGYGGYKYIPGLLSGTAKKIIKNLNLTKNQEF